MKGGQIVNFQPTKLNERVDSLDILRGFSLLGILIVNMYAFYLPLPHIDFNHWFTEANDIIWQRQIDIFVQGSFYPLFSMLFGYGLTMQYMKAQRTGLNFYRFGFRRLLVLFVLGLIHAIFIWWGDILATYAFCGLFLLLFIRYSRGWLLTIGLVINIFMHMSMITLLIFSGSVNTVVETVAVDLQMINNTIAAYGMGTWTDAFQQRLKDLAVQMNVGMWINSLFTILPYMLVGAAAAKGRIIERAKELKIFWITLAFVGIAVGLSINSAPYMFSRTYLLDYLKDYVGGPILSVGYAALIISLCMIPVTVKVLSPIAKAGRMSLTLYLMQSIISTLLFYNFGFSLYGEVSVQMGVFIAVGIYALQVTFAELWFTKFQQGPLELAVKKITYGKLMSEK